MVFVPAVEDVLAPLFERPGRFSLEAQVAFVDQRLAEMKNWILHLLESLPDVSAMVVTFGTDRVPGTQILCPSSPDRAQEAPNRFLAEMRLLGSLSPRVRVADWDWNIRTHGWAVYQDQRLWYLGRMRLNPMGTACVADFLAKHVAAERGKVRKVAVLDLDNTLWGGVVGEDGVEGLVLGNEGVGLAFQDVQREILKWHDAGVILAVCSKNNEQDGLSVFEKHPDMVLKREHLSAIRLNWKDKVENIRELAEELNLGLESFVFLDDNPVERGWVAQTLREVLVPELPKDPAHRPNFLRSADYFLRTQVTETDRSRVQSYRFIQQRDELRTNSTSLEEFLRSLSQEVEMRRLSQATLARAAQMSQRTNQFNLTTRRYSITELSHMISDPQFEVWTLAVRDKLEESGITGLGILRQKGKHCELDSLLLSCRILGRRVEDAFLAFLVERAKARGCGTLIGRYLPTNKNGQVARFYECRGFQPTLEEGVSSLDIANGVIPQSPECILVRVAGEE